MLPLEFLYCNKVMQERLCSWALLHAAIFSVEIPSVHFSKHFLTVNHQYGPEMLLEAGWALCVRTWLRLAPLSESVHKNNTYWYVHKTTDCVRVKWTNDVMIWFDLQTYHWCKPAMTVRCNTFTDSSLHITHTSSTCLLFYSLLVKQV